MYPDEMLISDEIYDIFRQWRQAERSEAEQLLLREAAAFVETGWVIDRHVGEGHIAQKIIETANELAVDLVAVGARGLSAVKGFLLGSVSEKVM